MPMKFPYVQPFPIDEVKLAEQVKTDPYLKQYAQKLTSLEAKRERHKMEHNMEMESMTIEKKVIKRRAFVRTNRLRLNLIRKTKQEIKNAEDAKAAEEFKKELRAKLEEPA